jgi:hypothetical protein
MPTNRIRWKLFDYHAKGRRERSATKEVEGLICLSRRSEQENALNVAFDVGDDDVAVHRGEKEQVNEAQQRFWSQFHVSVI